MGAAVEGMYLNKSVADTFLIAEDLFVKGGGLAVRNMAGAHLFHHQMIYTSSATNEVLFPFQIRNVCVTRVYVFRRQRTPPMHY
jgi:hypothetical protein